MRTTLDIDPELVEEAVAATGEKTKSKAVSKILEEYVRGIKIDELRAMAGKANLEDTWRELRGLDEERQRRRLHDMPGGPIDTG